MTVSVDAILGRLNLLIDDSPGDLQVRHTRFRTDLSSSCLKRIRPPYYHNGFHADSCWVPGDASDRTAAMPRYQIRTLDRSGSGRAAACVAA